jgi:hypothetical protein
MEGKSVNVVLAENLRDLMAKSEKYRTQMALAKAAKVDQKTISNYLNPDARLDGTNGKIRSAKLSEVEMIARVLKVDVWQLLKPKVHKSDKQEQPALSEQQ